MGAICGSCAGHPRVIGGSSAGRQDRGLGPYQGIQFKRHHISHVVRRPLAFTRLCAMYFLWKLAANWRKARGTAAIAAYDAEMGDGAAPVA